MIRFDRDKRVDRVSFLWFRDRTELEASLTDTGFSVASIRDAPDRPALEYVFIARRR